MAAPDLFMKSLAGSFQNAVMRCLLDIVETYPDRPTGMPEIARGQCRSLSVHPRRRQMCDELPTAKGRARPIQPLEAIPEDNPRGEIPSTHVFFIPDVEDNMGPAP